MNPSEIAKLITEDVHDNNGLILEHKWKDIKYLLANWKQFPALTDKYGNPLYEPELANDNEFMTNIVKILNRGEYYNGMFGLDTQQNLQLLADRLGDAKKYHKPGQKGEGHSIGRLGKGGYERRHPPSRD